MQVLSERIEFSTPWFDVVAKQTEAESAPYYSLRMQDYVSVVAVTREKELVLVRQYRPAVECVTLELPSGHVERNEAPIDAARRELLEECGFVAAEMEPLGGLCSDVGRHENRLWTFIAQGISPGRAPFVPEPGLERVLVPCDELGRLVVGGQLNHALDLAVLMLALAKLHPRVLSF